MSTPTPAGTCSIPDSTPTQQQQQQQQRWRRKRKRGRGLGPRRPKLTATLSFADRLHYYKGIFKDPKNAAEIMNNARVI
ncbi:hypothetical protein BGX23_000406, partial [Mortierella sp. AD031]